MSNRSRSSRHPVPVISRSRTTGHRHSAAAAARSRDRRVHPPPSLLRQWKPPTRRDKVLSRSSSEPILWTLRFFPDGDGDGPGGEPLLFPRFHTCTDIYSPDLHLLLSPSPRKSQVEGGWRSDGNYRDEAKVVMNVTVEGSPGPVRAMVRLGASVEEAIGLVVDAYGREGRSPQLDPAAASSFQLHHSHFSLQSLKKEKKLGDVGGRSFYLRRSCGGSGSSSRSSSFNGRSAGDAGGEAFTANAVGRCDQLGVVSTRRAASVALPPTHRFFSFITRRFLPKIVRRTRKLWKFLSCGVD